MSNSNEEPDFQWLEDGLAGLGQFAWSIVLSFWNLLCLIFGVAVASEDDDKQE